jgi:hypothetical protein
MLKLVDTKTAISMGAPVGRLVEVLATAGWNGEVLQDIINVELHEDLHARAVKMREG